jgi:hypothetical protein
LTLLLTVGDTTQLHQSSDYRLSDGGKALVTSNGAKQLSVSSFSWTAQIAFTGIAWDGRGYHTQNWLVDFCTAADSALRLDAFAEALTREATARLATATGTDHRLTLVIAAAQTGACRLFMVSNWESIHGAPLRHAADTFQWSEQGLRFPVFIVSGCEAGVPRSTRRHLIRLVRDGAHPKQVRHALAEVNRMTANDPKWTDVISPQCWVHSLLNDGQSAGINEGAIPGTPPMIHLGDGDLRARLRDRGLPALASRPVLRQTASYQGRGTASPPPAGEARPFPFISPGVARSIGRSDEEAHARLTISGGEGELLIRKNTEVLVKLAIVTLELTDLPAGCPAYSRRFLELPNPPTVDGAKPRSWNYPFDLEWDGTTFLVNLHTCSMAFRSGNHESPLPDLGAEEELTMAAPHEGLALTVTREHPRVEREILGRFMLRDFPELNLYRRPI